MAEAMRFEITDGVLAFAVVDTAAIGYLDSWQAPGGKTVETAVLADYTDANAQWACQITEASIDASANVDTQDVVATWCAAAKSVPQPAETSFAINGEYFSDEHLEDGLFAFLYANDTKEAFFLMGLNGPSSPPKAIGRCRIVAAKFGGAGRDATRTASLDGLPLSRRYDVWVGSAAPGVVIEGYPAGALMAAAAAPSPSSGSEAA